MPSAMKLSALFAGLLLSTVAVAKMDDKERRAKSIRSQRLHGGSPHRREPRVVKRDADRATFKNANTTKFAVDGKKIPDVNFDVGESYAGLLPVGESDGELFFWLWPTTAPDEPKEILLWLNGGPGCSSLDGLLKENGPFLWPSGYIGTVPNPWSWHHITNVVYVEQPIATGFSTGHVTAHNEVDVARQFMGFWKNLVDTFGLHGYKVYITGESYAGMYCSYISSAMLDANDTKYFDVKGMHIIDPIIGDPGDSPLPDFVKFWEAAFPFNDTMRAKLDEVAEKCGYNAYFEKYMVYPPAGIQPIEPPAANDTNDCDYWNYVFNAALEINPGFNEYLVSAVAPIPYDPLGFPSALFWTPPGLQPYFNRTDVKKAIHVPLDTNWQICANHDVFAGKDGDTSLVPALTVLPGVIERTNNVIITNGQNDMIVTDGSSLLTIQNMTWNKAMGFQCRPSAPIFVPIHDQGNDYYNLTGTGPITYGARGVTGTTHTERGLTWCQVTLAGHMVPSAQPATAFRQTEFLLGRVPSLQSNIPLSNYPGVPQPDPKTFGEGTARKIGKGPACKHT